MLSNFENRCTDDDIVVSMERTYNLGWILVDYFSKKAYPYFKKVEIGAFSNFKTFYNGTFCH